MSLLQAPPHCAGLYVHVPFCLQKCPYCNFYSRPAQSGDFECFTEALLAHLAILVHNPLVQNLRFTTIFFGGGTPSVLPTPLLVQILRACQATLNCSGCTEISIEVNPGTIAANSDSLHALFQAGFNRLSVGVQSFLDHELKLLGRTHSADEARMTLATARKAGFSNISLDLMYGLPGQQLRDWQASLEQALVLAPEHLSVYELTPEAPSPFYDAAKDGTLALPPEEEVLAMMDYTKALLTRTGLARYEISNYAQPAYQCRHNLNYWHNGSYLGLGPGAVSAIGGRRYRIPQGLRRYYYLVTSDIPPWQAEEMLDVEQSFRETVIMGLRMMQGVSAAELFARYQINLATYYGPVLDQLLAQELLHWQGEYLALSPKGLPLANQVMAELV